MYVRGEALSRLRGVMQMTNKEAIETINIAIAEVEWDYPMDYAIAFEMAIDALEKHVPKKPKEYEDKFYACPVCRNVLLHKWKKYNTELIDKSNGLPYCLSCGQKLDWSDEE